MKRLTKFSWLLLAAIAFASCSDDKEAYTPPKEKYTGGFYVFNEGSFGHTPASVNYYDAKEGWTLNIYQANNGGETLGNTGSIAVCDAENMYIVTKETPFLVKVGLSDFVKKAALPADAFDVQARSFALLDANRGVLTTTKSAYIVTLDPLQLSEEPFFEDGPQTLAGDVAVSGGYIFLLGSENKERAIMAYDATTLKFVKNVGTATTGFAKAGGALWAGNKDKIVKINVSDLSVQEFPLGGGLSVYYNQWAFAPTGLQASIAGDALFFANGDASGYDIYKFSVASGSASKFFSAPVVDEKECYVYGQGVNVDPKTGDLYLVYTNDYGTNTSIYVVDGNTGAQKLMFPYTDSPYWYPTMFIFR